MEADENNDAEDPSAVYYNGDNPKNVKHKTELIQSMKP